MHELSKGSRLAVCLVLALDRGIPLFYPQCNAREVRLNSKQTAKQQPCQFQSVKVLFDSSRPQWPNDPLPFEIFLSPLLRVWWIQIFVNNVWSSVVPGMASVLTSVCFLLNSSLCRPHQLLLKCCFTSTETVGLLGTATSNFTQLLNSVRIRIAMMFIWRLGSLKTTGVYTFIRV